MLKPSHIHTILELIDKNLIIFITKTIGEVGLSDTDKQVLKENGIDFIKLYDEKEDLVKLNFQLGMLSQILSNPKVQSLTAQELLRYVASGKYIPLNERERATIDSIKMQSLADIRSNREKIFQDINNVVAKVSANTRSNQEEYLRGKIIEGVSDRATRKQIATEIAKHTGDWSRNFDKAVAYVSHTALNEGRAAMIERRYEKYGQARVWFSVQPEACPHCVKAYLKGGEGSEPKVFHLKEIISNGNNIGRKTQDWLPCFIMHVHCRCLIQEYQEGTIWDADKKRFMYPANREHKKIDRPKIKITIDGVEHLV